MPRGGAHFSGDELGQVLSHYDIGVIRQVTPLSAGNARAPKMVIISDRGKFLLKRRPRGKDDLYHVAFAHAVQTHLAERAFPVTTLIATTDEKNTVLQIDNHIYELFQFVKGLRYDGSVEATVDAGRQLAQFHRSLADFPSEWKPLRASFHDSSMVRRRLKMAGAERGARPDKKLQDIAKELMTIYNASTVRVNELGFDSWPEQIVHGDWHPGNMLFAGGRLVAVLDFDSVRMAAPVTDLANGMLQFCIVGGRPNPADWPAYLDHDKLLHFLEGYRRVVRLNKRRLHSLLDLMIETMIAEAILPVAATGFFGNLSGLDFLKMIHRKCRWIKKNRKKLTQAMRP
ncbi:MAG: phosphotransferase enzyme family protein [Planctomycetota bacterium]|jgi:homoserine kinase type II